MGSIPTRGTGGQVVQWPKACKSPSAVVRRLISLNVETHGRSSTDVRLPIIHVEADWRVNVTC